MQERHDRTLAESVMLCPTCQTSWVMENLHDKSSILPDPDIFAIHKAVNGWTSVNCCRATSAVFETSGVNRLLYARKSFASSASSRWRVLVGCNTYQL